MIFKVLETAGQQGLPVASLPFAFNTTNKAPHQQNLLALADGDKENQLTWLHPLNGVFHADLNVFVFAIFFSFSAYVNLAAFVF